MGATTVQCTLPVEIKFDNDAQVYVASCLVLNVKSQGETEIEANLALADAVNLYVKNCYQRSQKL